MHSVRELIAGIGLDPDVVTVYALRHTNITRMLLRKVPVRLVASLHNTSVGMIERNYSRYIVEHGDEHARVGLLENLAPTSPPASNVVSMRGHD